MKNMREEFNGRTVAFQATHGGSIPLSRSLQDSTQSVVQTGNIVYKIDRVHSLHCIIHGKEEKTYAVENSETYGPKNSITI